MTRTFRTRVAGLVGMMAVSAAFAAPGWAQAQEKSKVIAQAANTRSGPGEYWYVTGQLKRGDVVTVVGNHGGWAEIVPPAGHYSWVLKSQVDANGTVIGDSPVAVRAGEQGGKRLNKIQTYLTPAPTSKVSIIRAWGAYYQIVPPAGATVFVKANLLDVGGGGDTASANSTIDSGNTAAGNSTPPTTTGPEVAHVGRTTPPTTTAPEPDTASMAQIRARVAADQQMIREQLTKPLLDRDYSKLLARFEQLKGDKRVQTVSGMDQYADAMIAWTQQQIRLQTAAREMSTTRPDVDQIIADARAKVGPTAVTPPYQASGILRKSEALGNSVSMPRLHKLESLDGQKVICYLVPETTDDWTGLEGKQVEVSGTREYRADWNFYLVHPQQLKVVGEGTVINRQPVPPTGGGDEPPDIGPLLPGNIFVDTPSPAPTETPKVGPGAEAPAPKDSTDLLPAGHPTAPVPELRPLVPTTQEN